MVYLDQFRYPRLDLKPREIYTERGEKWIKQKIEIDATYGGETIIIYIFLPKIGNLHIRH